MNGSSRQFRCRSSLRFAIVALAVWLLAWRASAAISQGPILTNAVASEQRRLTQYYHAEQSYQEKLKAGQERYDKKQVIRAKIIAAMQADLQARQQTVVIEPSSPSSGNPNAAPPSLGPSVLIAALAFGFIGFGFYLKRDRPSDV